MSNWSTERSEAARIHAERLAAAQAREHREARALIADFVARAKEANLPAEPLRVGDYSSSATARTPLSGWYLKGDHSVGIDTDGNFYVLTARLSLKDRISGIRPTPEEPPLVIGAGGRDGESIDLRDALDRLLPPEK